MSRILSSVTCCKELNKALQTKVGQKPAWSEEDDYNLQCMIAKVTSDIQKGKVGRNNELIDWLKSIKDRYTLKPSEEQMDALDDVISSRDIKYDVLSELWKDLKKLREE